MILDVKSWVVGKEYKPGYWELFAKNHPFHKDGTPSHVTKSVLDELNLTIEGDRIVDRHIKGS